jgi:hypothetical protein
VRSSVVSHLATTPPATSAHQIAHLISNGSAARAITATPAPLRGLVAHAARAGFVSGLNEILLVGAVVAFTGAAVSLGFIRERDLVAQDEVAVAVAA